MLILVWRVRFQLDKHGDVIANNHCLRWQRPPHQWSRALHEPQLAKLHCQTWPFKGN